MKGKEVVIVMARCQRNRQAFGIRFEQSGGQWIGDWAFALKESAAKREGYDRSRIAGEFGFAATYPGCPHCRNPEIVRCGCGKVACWDTAPSVVCPWCGVASRVEGVIEALEAGGDR